LRVTDRGEDGEDLADLSSKIVYFPCLEAEFERLALEVGYFLVEAGIMFYEVSRVCGVGIIFGERGELFVFLNKLVVLGDELLVVFLQLREGRIFMLGCGGRREAVVFFSELSVSCFETRVFLAGVVVITTGEAEEIFDYLLVRDKGLVTILNLRFFFVESVVPVLELGKVVDA
jgi:hypothetical protein